MILSISIILLFTDHSQMYQSCAKLLLRQTEPLLLLLLHVKSFARPIYWCNAFIEEELLEMQCVRYRLIH